MDIKQLFDISLHASPKTLLFLCDTNPLFKDICTNEDFWHAKYIQDLGQRHEFHHDETHDWSTLYRQDIQPVVDMDDTLNPTVNTVDIRDSILYHQRHDEFKGGRDRPYYTFAYFSRDKPHYSGTGMNIYRYTVNGMIPYLIFINDDYFPEDLYKWLNAIMNKDIEEDAYVIGNLLISLGYNGWYIDNPKYNTNEYILSKEAIDNKLDFLDKTIVNPGEPEEESHGKYFL